MDGGGERRSVVVPVLELAEAGGDELVERVVLAFERFQELGDRLGAILGAVERDPVLHAASATTS